MKKKNRKKFYFSTLKSKLYLLYKILKDQVQTRKPFYYFSIHACNEQRKSKRKVNFVSRSDIDV